MTELGDVLATLMQVKRITDEGLGAELPAAEGYGGLRVKPPVARRFCVIKKKLF